MIRGVVARGLLAVLLAAAPTHAQEAGLRWEAQEAAFPVAPEAVLPHAPFVPPGTPRTAGKVELGPGRAAAFFLTPRALVRITVLGGEGRALRLARVLGPPEPPTSGRGPRALLEELPETQGQARFALQPPGMGNVWLLWAEQPLSVRLERPVYDAGLLAWEDAHAQLPRWVRGEVPFPELPAAPGTLELQQRLEAQAWLASALAAHPEASPALQQALPLWRTAEALRELERVRPTLPGLVAQARLTSRLAGVREAVLLEGAEGETLGAPYHRFLEAKGHWEVRLKGPGVARLEARALLTAEQGTPGRLLHLAVSTGGARPEVRRERSVPVRVPALEPGAFPTPRAWRREGESFVGSRLELAFELLPGEHTYRLDFTGGPALLRLGVTRRRPRLSEWWQHRATPGDWQRAAEAALAGDSSLPGQVLRQRWSNTPASVDAAALPPALRATALHATASPVSDTRLLTSVLEEAAREPLPAAARAQLLVEGARHLARSGASAEAFRILSLLGDEAPAGALLQAAELLTELPTPLASESLELALLARAWRLAPLRPEVRERYLEAFSRRTSWRQLPPAAEGPPPEPWRWLDALSPSTDGLTGEGAEESFWTLAAGQSGTLNAPADATGQPAWLRAYLETPPEAPGPVELSIGGERFPLLGLARLEPVEVLVPPGLHPIRLEGPPATRLHLSLPLAEAPGPMARVRVGWPTAVGAPARFGLPPASTSHAVRFELRGVEKPEPVTLLIEGAGPPRQLRFEPGEPAASSAPLGLKDPPATAPVVGILEVPSGPHTLSFLPEGAVPLAVSVATRWPELVEEDTAKDSPPAGVPGQAALVRLRTLSLALRERPTSPWLRRARARLLLGLGEERLALGDLLSLVAHQPGEAELAALFAQASTEERPKHLELVSWSLTRPLLLRPGLSVLSREERGQAEKERTAYLQARLQLDNGTPLEGARELAALAQETDQWTLLLEAAQGLSPVLSRLPTGDLEAEGTASLAFGVAARLEQHLVHPAAELLGVIAGRRTAWKRLEDAEESGGIVRLTLGTFEAEEEDSLHLRRLLVGAPWPLAEGQALRPGGSARVKVELPAASRVRAEVVCTALEPGAGDAPCPVALRVDSQPLTHHPLPVGSLQELEVGRLPAGTHQLELLLPPEQGGLAAEVRFLREAAGGGPFEVIPSQSAVTALLAQSTRPVVLTVLGPATLRVEAWGFGEQPAPRLHLETTALPRGERLVSSLMPPAAQATGPAPQPAEHLLLLTQHGPHRLVLRPPEGAVAVRLALRVEREVPLPEGPPRRALLAERLSPLPMRPPPSLHLLPPGRARVPAGELGTLSLLVGQGWEQELQEDSLELQSSAGTSVALAWRRELHPRRLWVRAEPSFQVGAGAEAVMGARAELGAQGLPLKLRLHARAEAFTQRTLEMRAWGARGRLLVDRLYHPAADWQLLPSLGAWLEKAWLPGEAWEVDSRVATQYGLDHPQRWEARLAARWSPLQDHMGTFFTQVTSNEDLITVDHQAAGLSWRALLGASEPTPVRVELGYALSHHPADRYRYDSYLRHQGTLEVDVHLWRGEWGRLLLWGRTTVRQSWVFGLAHTGLLGLRLDFNSGRGWRDLMPWEEEFELLLEGRRWEEDVGGRQ